MVKNIKKNGEKIMAHLIRFESFCHLVFSCITDYCGHGVVVIIYRGFFFCQSDYCAHNVIALVTSDEGSKNSGMINDHL